MFETFFCFFNCFFKSATGSLGQFEQRRVPGIRGEIQIHSSFRKCRLRRLHHRKAVATVDRRFGTDLLRFAEFQGSHLATETD